MFCQFNSRSNFGKNILLVEACYIKKYFPGKSTKGLQATAEQP